MSIESIRQAEYTYQYACGAREKQAFPNYASAVSFPCMRLLFCATAATAAASLVTAWLTDAFLHQRIAIIGSFVGLQRSHNAGIAFGVHLGPYQEVIITVALAVLAYAAWKSAHTQMEQAGFGCILGGGAANLIDRAMNGYVTDMIQIGTFPVFNLADMCINVGVALLLLQMLLQRSHTPKRAHSTH